MGIEAKLNRSWYEGARVPLWASLLSLVFRFIVSIRRALYRAGIFRSHSFPVPVIVVGNVTVGGTGKSPLTLALVERLRAAGVSCGIVSRGYGGKVGKEPLFVEGDSDPTEVGDEAVMLARRADVPVCIHPSRVKAAQALLAGYPVAVLLCDDGLQHYALARDMEIALIDASRGLGNGRMLPAGPLREPRRRLDAVDYVVINGMGDGREVPLRAAHYHMQLEPSALVNIRSGERRDAGALVAEKCVAVAGIGNPQRFFGTLSALGYSAECRAFPDHHAFSESDFGFSAGRPVLMTEKDAVKCASFARDNWWYLAVDASLEEGFAKEFIDRVRALRRPESRRGKR